MDFKSSSSSSSNNNTNQVILDVEDDELGSSCLPSSTCLCRICHEEEKVEGATMETPCACSGTLKFAHRGCIQRWCDVKGSTHCEICLQNFEPDYTVAPKIALVDVGVTISGSLEVSRLEYEPPAQSDDELATVFNQCSPTSRGCRSLAVTFTIMLLLRHMITVVSLGANNYGFTLLTVFILRSSGILLPFFFIMRMISALQRVQRRHHQQLDEADDSLQIAQADSLQSQHQIIQIQA